MGVTTAVALAAVAYSHYAQVEERRVMRAGVERDKERLRMKQQARKQRES